MTLRLLRRFVCCLCWFVLMESAAVAHHSFAAEYDANKPVTLKGTITKVEWTNPKGQVVKWEISGPSVNSLARNGAKKDSLKAGQMVTVEGFLARHVENLANMRFVKSVDGKLLLDRIGDQQ